CILFELSLLHNLLLVNEAYRQGIEEGQRAIPPSVSAKMWCVDGVFLRHRNFNDVEKRCKR
ncbi:hypothetical protein M1O57_04895, partial [Dehalococcoidia bacterium]|nr:hypothetical protein [Dehalococcoidia bacterium]MCL0104906.1 hypothetical protein [Dehalococcoidia bacterium]